MARAALQIGIREVGELSQVAPSTISRFEAGEELKPRTLVAIRQAFEKQGIEFLDGDAPGIRLHQRPTRMKKKK
jgi:hypothetical protein